MAKKTLVVDGGDSARFLLAVDADELRIGDSPAHTTGVLRGVRVVRVRCEIELEDDRDELPVDEPGVLARRALRPGESLQVGRAHLSLPATGPAPTPAPPPVAAAPVEPAPEPAPDAPPASGPRRLKVVDGGDQGRSFLLPDEGTARVGKPGHADIRLHDLYVAPVHCTLDIGPAGVTVTHIDGASGTLIDGRRITRTEPLKPGSVLRVGNSHLRLEVAPFADDSAVPFNRARPPSERPPAPAYEEVEEEAEEAAAGLEGQTIGNCRVGRLLGRGFTGAVYQATHVQTGQGVALKVLAAGFPAATAELDRFAREVKAAQPVRHPNLLVLYGAGKSSAGCWIAREFVPGESAAEAIGRVAQGEKPSWTRAARVLVHLARALECLQKHRLVHGNITPANVLLREEDGATKLADLRLAQALEGSQLQQAVLEEKLLAELPYLAPEQADPGAFVDALADLYAVGAVAYALVTGRPPVSGRTPEEILEHIQEGRVVRPGAVYKKVPAAFDGVVMRLLARHQEDRYPTAAALLADLAPLAENHDLQL